jgi:hypothetical protein
MDPQIVALIIVSVISETASLFVVITPLCFHSMRYRMFMQIVAFISIGDMIGNFPYMFPYRPGPKNWWCILQAFMNIAGYPMAWIWTTILVYLLFSLALSGKIPEKMIYFHILAWGLPIVLALFQLTVSKYHRNVSHYDVCVDNDLYKTHIYHCVTNYGLLFACLFTMILFYLKIFQLELSNDPNVSSNSFKTAKYALIWYPTILAIFWIPHALTSMFFHNNQLYYYFLVLKVFHGFATALVFILQSKESRKLWSQCIEYQLLQPILRSFRQPLASTTTDENKNNTNSSDSERKEIPSNTRIVQHSTDSEFIDIDYILDYADVNLRMSTQSLSMSPL